MLGYVMVQYFPRGTDLPKPGFHMIATIAVIAAITREWFPYDRRDRLTFFQRSQRSWRSYENQALLQRRQAAKVALSYFHLATTGVAILRIFAASRSLFFAAFSASRQLK